MKTLLITLFTFVLASGIFARSETTSFKDNKRSKKGSIDSLYNDKLKNDFIRVSVQIGKNKKQSSTKEKVNSEKDYDKKSRAGRHDRKHYRRDKKYHRHGHYKKHHRRHHHKHFKKRDHKRGHHKKIHKRKLNKKRFRGNVCESRH